MCTLLSSNALRFNQLYNALRAFEPIWQHEVINRYPDHLECFPEEWVEQLRKLGPSELFALEHGNAAQLLPKGTLKEYYCQFQELSKLAQRTLQPLDTFNAHAFMRIKGKKRHEIENVCSLLHIYCGGEKKHHGVDFAGGMGNLAMVLAKYLRLPMTSLDVDGKLQATGKKKYAAYLPPDAAPLEFIQTDILALDSLPPLHDLTFSIGLHTCGGLARAQLQLSAQATIPTILNFSCCYYKMQEHDYFLSSQAQALPMRLSTYARTLASRSPRFFQQDYYNWKRVKLYRYLIHLFLFHQLGITEFKALGNSPAKLYQGAFAEYGLEQLSRLGLVNEASQGALEEFARNARWQKIANDLILMNIIRSFSARPLELLILFDRGLFLEEYGYEVSLQCCFEPQLSPRNVAILAHR